MQRVLQWHHCDQWYQKETQKHLNHVTTDCVSAFDWTQKKYRNSRGGMYNFILLHCISQAGIGSLKTIYKHLNRSLITVVIFILQKQLTEKIKPLNLQICYHKNIVLELTEC